MPTNNFQYAKKQIESLLKTIAIKEGKKPKEELDISIENALKNIEKDLPEELKWMAEPHGKTCPKTGQPYETKDDSPGIQGTLYADNTVYTRCKSCGMIIGSYAPRGNVFKA